MIRSKPVERAKRGAISRPARHSARYLWSHRKLLWRVSNTELRSRYAGSLLGLGWSALAPTFVLAIYALVYLVIFRVQVPHLTAVGYVLYVFAGLVPYLATAEALGMGVGSVIANKSVLSNTVFPIDLAGPKSVLLSQVTMGVGMAAIIIGLAVNGLLHWTVLLVPVLWVLMVLGLVGATWILSLLNVVFRDLQNLVSPLLMMLLVISPIAYTPEMVPSRLQLLLLLNPFAYFVTAFQATLVLGTIPGPGHLAVIVVGSVGLFLIGGWFFSRTKAVLVDYV